MQNEQLERSALINSPNRLFQNLGWRFPSQISLLGNRGTEGEEEVITQVSQTLFYTNLASKGLLNILAVFLLAYYWTNNYYLHSDAGGRFVNPRYRAGIPV